MRTLEYDLAVSSLNLDRAYSFPAVDEVIIFWLGLASDVEEEAGSTGHRAGYCQ